MNNSSVVQLNEWEVSVRFFDLEVSRVLSFLRDNNSLSIESNDVSSDSWDVVEEVGKIVSVKFCHVCLIFVSIMK